MIFVTVGVQLPFDRLICAMDRFAADHPDIEIIAQTGVTPYQCRHMQAYARLESREFQSFVERAELIVAHAGMGSILTALELGKPIIVLPRVARLGEHRNDHQAATSQYMAQADLVRVAKNLEELISLIANRHLLQPRTISAVAQPSLTNAISLFLSASSDKISSMAISQPPRPPRPPTASGTVSVIVPHYNDLQNLKLCIAALRGQSQAPFEIIVCDNNSSCGLAAVERVCGRAARVILETNKGAAAARNAAVRAASGDILAFTDSDCVPLSDWILQGCQVLDNADLVGGRVMLSFKNAAQRTPVEAFEAQYAFANKRYVEKEHFSVTANMFVRRGTFEHVGDFRADVPEDKDWGQRAHKLGYRWAYAADAALLHPARRSWPELRSKWQRLTREAYAFSGHRVMFLARSWLLILSVPLFAARLIRSKTLSGWGERLAVSSVLIKLRCWRVIECHRLVVSDLFDR